MQEQRGLARTVAGNGIPLLVVSAGILILAGAFAMFLALTGEFLPHDLAYLGMSADELCGIADCHVVHFMLHDRMAFGGSIFGIGVLYAYLALYPLSGGEAWAWWLFTVSGALGFASFLGYLGFGYLDTWHGLITLCLLPLFVVGLILTRRTLATPAGLSMFTAVSFPDLRTRAGLGRACLMLGTAGTVVAGLEIFRIGLMETFVPSDLVFLGVSAEHLEHIDRAGFGAAVVIQALLGFGALWCGRTGVEVSRALWQSLLVAGTVSLGAAIGTHFQVGYIDAWHIAPPAAAAASLIVGLALSYPSSERSS
jgi:hypothetical protein